MEQFASRVGLRHTLYFSLFFEDVSRKMCYSTRMKLHRRVWNLSPCPDPPSSVDPPTAHPTPLSIARAPGEVSRQRVTSFFPVLRIGGGVPGSQGRQGARHAAALLS